MTEIQNESLIRPVDVVGKKLRGDEAIPYLVEVNLKGNSQDAFLIVMETLTRIGIASRKEKNVLFQTAHILSKKGKYYIVNFKSMFILDRKQNDLTVGDVARTNRIIKLLEDWDLIEVVHPEAIDDPQSSLANICVVSFKEKENWDLRQKYSIGSKKHKQ